VDLDVDCSPNATQDEPMYEVVGQEFQVINGVALLFEHPPFSLSSYLVPAVHFYTISSVAEPSLPEPVPSAPVSSIRSL
jgi:hypothetical protein